ncbi:MAG: C-GCAxxG-C-C family protein [Anaerovoracaceae bacterium]
MSERMEKAVDYHHNKFNCSQAVVCTFADKLDVPEKDLFRMAEAFGFGMGAMGTCGAVTAMALVIGLSESDGNMEDPQTKKNCYRAMKRLTRAFEEKNGTVICSQLKGKDTGVVIRSCDGCIEDAVELLEGYFSDKEAAKEQT